MAHFRKNGWQMKICPFLINVTLLAGGLIFSMFIQHRIILYSFINEGTRKGTGWKQGLQNLTRLPSFDVSMFFHVIFQIIGTCRFLFLFISGTDTCAWRVWSTGEESGWREGEERGEALLIPLSGETTVSPPPPPPSSSPTTPPPSTSWVPG